MANPSGSTEDEGRDWVRHLARAVLAIYLLPALLAALAVGALALAAQAVIRALTAIASRWPGPPRSPGPEPRRGRHDAPRGGLGRPRLPLREAHSRP